MAPRRTFTEQNRAQLARLHAEGKSLREIADLMGFAPATISNHAKALLLDFDRSQTDMATRARKIDLAEARVLLAQKVTLIANDLLDATERPYTVYSFGGASNTFRDKLLDRPPADVKRQIITAAAIAIDKASKVLETSSEGLTGAHSLLDALANGFERAALEYEAGLSDGQ